VGLRAQIFKFAVQYETTVSPLSTNNFIGEKRIKDATVKQSHTDRVKGRPRTGIRGYLGNFLAAAVSYELESARVFVETSKNPGPAGSATAEGRRRELAVLGRWVVLVLCDSAKCPERFGEQTAAENVYTLVRALSY